MAGQNNRNKFKQKAAVMIRTALRTGGNMNSDSFSMYSGRLIAKSPMVKSVFTSMARVNGLKGVKNADAFKVASVPKKKKPLRTTGNFYV